MVADIMVVENDLSNPVFYWGAQEYPCVPSVNEETRELDEGGFVMDKVLSMVVRLEDTDGNLVFDNNLVPTPQEKVTYNGEAFRIITTKRHPTGAYMRIMAISTVKGI